MSGFQTASYLRQCHYDRLLQNLVERVGGNTCASCFVIPYILELNLG